MNQQTFSQFLQVFGLETFLLSPKLIGKLTPRKPPASWAAASWAGGVTDGSMAAFDRYNAFRNFDGPPGLPSGWFSGCFSGVFFCLFVVVFFVCL